ncbi:hypothetical protein P9112_009989 [Eukaryota sp. TZLM1-RC]
MKAKPNILKNKAKLLGQAEVNSKFDTIGYLVLDNMIFRLHLYVSGPSSIVETTIIRLLKKAGLKVYMAPDAGKFEDFENFRYDVCIADEPNRIGTQQISHWMAWLDGGYLHECQCEISQCRENPKSNNNFSFKPLNELVLDTVDEEQKNNMLEVLHDDGSRIVHNYHSSKAGIPVMLAIWKPIVQEQVAKDYKNINSIRPVVCKTQPTHHKFRAGDTEWQICISGQSQLCFTSLHEDVAQDIFEVGQRLSDWTPQLEQSPQQQSAAPVTQNQNSS